MYGRSPAIRRTFGASLFLGRLFVAASPGPCARNWLVVIHATFLGLDDSDGFPWRCGAVNGRMGHGTQVTGNPPYRELTEQLERIGAPIVSAAAETDK